MRGATDAAKYFGVSERRGKFRARITVDGQTHSLGTFETAKDAAMEYDNAAKRLKGERVKRMNFPGLQVLGSKLLRMDEPVWKSSDGRNTPLSLLASNHLRNIERVLRYRGAVIPAGGTQTHWYAAIELEMEKRGLEKLPDHPNQTYETVEVPIYTFASRNRRTKKPGRKRKIEMPAVIDVIDAPKVSKMEWFVPTGRTGPPVNEIGTCNLAQLVLGEYKNEIIHRNSIVFDCRRMNLFVNIPKTDYIPAPDRVRIPRDRPHRPAKAQIRAKMDTGC